MATNKGYKRFDRRITRKLENLKNINEAELIAIFNKNVNIARDTIYETLPERTGELKRGVFGDVFLTNDGVACEVGIANTPHGEDDFTNTTLAGWLLNKPNAPPQYGKKTSNSQHQMQEVIDILNDLKYDISYDIEQYWYEHVKGGN